MSHHPWPPARQQRLAPLPVRLVIAALVVLSVLLSMPRAHAQEALNVAVLNMEGSGIDPNLLSTLTAVLRHEAQQHEQYAVVNPAPINLSEIIVVLGCNPEAVSCLRQAAEQVEARILIYGTVSRSAAGFRFTVEIFDSASSRVIHQLARTLDDTDDPVITFRREIEAFFAGQSALPATRLQIGSNIEGAEIRIEGMLVGTTPLERTGLPAGTYRVEVDAPGYSTWSVVVDLVAGGEIRLWAPLAKAAAGDAALAAETGSTTAPPSASPASTLPSPPASAAPGSSLHDEYVPTTNWGAWGAISVGVAALGGSAVMAVLMRSAEQDIERESTAGTLTQQRYDELVSRGEGYETSHRILLGVGGAATAAGVLWLILDDRSEPATASAPEPARPAWSVEIGPTHVGARLRF